MTIIITILTIIDAMVALLLIAVVLIQQSKDGGFGGAPFGGAGDSVFGAQAADHLTKITIALASIFLILTLSLAIITGRRSDEERNLLDDGKDEKSELTELVKESDKDVKKKDQEIIDELGGIKKDDPNKIVIPKTDENKPVKVKLKAPQKIKDLINKKKSEASKMEAEKAEAPKNLKKKPEAPKPE